MQEQDFPESNLITADHVGKPVFRGANCSSVVLELELEQSSPDCELRWSRLRRKGAPERSSSGVLQASWSKPLPGKSCS
jgi:hypothetical protein